jgi:1,2-diacylglycerol 3-beta-galactosyltransferase
MLAEGLACGGPLLLTGYLPGQEAGNVREIVGRGLGSYVPRPAELVRAVQDWYAKPEAERKRDSEKARSAGNPEAAFEIAELLARLTAS